MVVLVGLEAFVHAGHGDALHDVEDEDGVVCGERASAFGDDVGVGDAVLVGCIDEGIDAVVDVLLVLKLILIRYLRSMKV